MQVLTPDSLLGFFAAAGFKTHRSATGCWYEAGPRFLLGVPTHDQLEIGAAEAREIFRATGALGLRYVAKRPDLGRESWQMSATGAGYSMENFSGNTRSKIRRGLKSNEIRRVSGAELARGRGKAAGARDHVHHGQGFGGEGVSAIRHVASVEAF